MLLCSTTHVNMLRYTRSSRESGTTPWTQLRAGPPPPKTGRRFPETKRSRCLAKCNCSNMVSFVVLIDTLRSLHMGMAASSISAFADITLEAPHHSLSGLLSQTLFAGPQTEWPAFSQDNALLTILLILSHTLIWVREMSPLAPSAETVSPQGRSNVDAETQKCRIRIERALDKWEGQYSRGALPETRALFYFCRMHLRAPHLHLVAVYAQYEPLATLSPIPLEKVSSIVEADTSTLDEAAHFAWLVLEQVPDAADVTALWLPIILYFSGLLVWMNIASQGRSRSHGSLRVLQLFGQKLSCMPWPCCAAFAHNLERIAMS